MTKNPKNYMDISTGILLVKHALDYMEVLGQISSVLQ